MRGGVYQIADPNRSRMNLREIHCSIKFNAI